MRSLGEFLRSQQRPDYQPYFSVKEKAGDPDFNKVRVTDADNFNSALNDLTGRNQSENDRGYDSKSRVAFR